MKVIKIRNVNHALQAGLEYIYQEGLYEDSRAGPVWVSPCPVTTVYEKPQERVLFSAARDANPFFHIFEALWLLAGRNDARWLDQFVYDFSSRFAEEDGTLHDAYGFRWRKHFDIEGGGSPYLPDQLETVVNLLRKNLQDRQAVIAMWDPPSDLGIEGLKARPCLAGDTVLWSPEGDLAIKELATKFRRGTLKRWPVYAVHHKNGRGRDSSIIAWATNVWKSGRRSTIQIKFDDGSVIKCTNDHQFYKCSGRRSLVEAGNLKPGDRIQARSRCIDPKGYVHFGECAAFSPGSKVASKYAQLLFGSKPKGYAVHHKNEHKSDDRASNLIYMQEAEHNKHHRTEWWANKTEEERRAVGAKFEAGKTAEGRARISTLASAQMKAHWDKIPKEERRQYSAMMSKARWGQQNHVVVSVKPGPIEDVYDFTVPEYHNAIVGTGVVTHNCNTHAYLRVRQQQILVPPDGGDEKEPVLDLTVCCRSNDLIWGAYGANAVQFSILQEYLAARIGVGIGTYYQVSHNYHAYKDMLDKLEEKAILEEGRAEEYPAEVTPIVTVPAHFDNDLQRFFASNQSMSASYANPFFREIAAPLYWAHHNWKLKNRTTAWGILSQMPQGSDWRLAAEQWFARRMPKSESMVK